MKRFVPFLFVIGLVACNNQPKEEIQSKPDNRRYNSIVNYVDSVSDDITEYYKVSIDSTRAIKPGIKSLEASISVHKETIKRFDKLNRVINAFGNDGLSADQLKNITQIQFDLLEQQTIILNTQSQLESSMAKIQR